MADLIARRRPLKVMISSSKRDLKEKYLPKAKQAVQEAQCQLIHMDGLYAHDADGLRKSLDLVDDCDVYVGIVAFRYGSTVGPEGLSFTHHEYNRACERENKGERIARLIFLMDDNFQPISFASYDDIESDDKRRKLKEFRTMLGQERTCAWFESPDSLLHAIKTSLDNLTAAQAVTHAVGSSGPTAAALKLRPGYHDLQSQLIRQKLAGGRIRQDQEHLPRRFRTVVERPLESEEVPSVLGMLKDYRGVVIRGSAGAGKSTECLMMFRRLLEPDETATTRTIPVLLECRDFAARIRGRIRMNTLPADDLSLAQATQELMFELMGSPFDSVDTRPESAETLIRAYRGFKPVLLVEGFDELAFDTTDTTHYLDLFVDRLNALLLEFSAAEIGVVISTRDTEARWLSRFQFPHVEPSPLTDRDVRDHLKSRHALDDGRCEQIAKLFLNELGGRPLYLRPLVTHHEKYLGAAAGVSYTALIDDEVHLQIANHSHRCSLDPNGRIAQRCCLRALAGCQLRDGRISVESFRATVAAATAVAELRKQLSDVLPLFLQPCVSGDSDGSDYEFPHQEFRDYWLAEGVIADLLDHQTDSGRFARLCLPRVFDHAARLVKMATAADQRRITAALVSVVNSGGLNPGSDRRVPTPAALSLGLLAQLEDLGQIDGLDCRRRSFQGFSGAGVAFEDLDFSGSSFRDANLSGSTWRNCTGTGIVLDNAELYEATFENCDFRGAVLKNAAMGRRPAASGSEPTSFRNVMLHNANWFNIRVNMKGYFQFWHAKVLDQGRRLLVSAGAGNLWLYLLDRMDEPPTRFPGIHTAAILDFDYREEGRRLVTASRDLTVQCLEFDETFSRLQQRQRIEGFSFPPRSIAFSRDGEWIAVTDFGHNVLFYPAKSDLPQPSKDSCRTLHTGPVMTLSTNPAETRANFLTCGYDGRLIRHVATRSRSRDWSSRELYRFFDPSGPGEPDVMRVTREWTGAGGRAGLWLGGEARRLHFAEFDGDTVARVTEWDFPAEIFRIGVSSDRTAIVLGFANGSLETHRIVDEAGAPLRLEPLQRIEMPRSDIVRVAEYLDDDCILCVAWSGSLRIWSCRRSAFVFNYEFPEGGWNPDLDADVLRIQPKSEIDGLLNLSGTFRTYLRRLP